MKEKKHMKREKIFYVRVDGGRPYKVYGQPWSTHKSVYSSQICWFSPYADLIILEADTKVEITYRTYINSDGSYCPVIISKRVVK